MCAQLKNRNKLLPILVLVLMQSSCVFDSVSEKGPSPRSTDEENSISLEAYDLLINQCDNYLRVSKPVMDRVQGGLYDAKHLKSSFEINQLLAGYVIAKFEILGMELSSIDANHFKYYELLPRVVCMHEDNLNLPVILALDASITSDHINYPIEDGIQAIANKYSYWDDLNSGEINPLGMKCSEFSILVGRYVASQLKIETERNGFLTRSDEVLQTKYFMVRNLVEGYMVGLQVEYDPDSFLKLRGGFTPDSVVQKQNEFNQEFMNIFSV